jgi:RNA polymerase sigma-70 factor (ECF subfamily)
VGSPHVSVLLAEYLAKRDALRHFLTAQLKSREDAEDVLQDLYVKVSRTPDIDDLQKPASYLFKMAVNLAHDRRRERKRAKLREADWVSVLYTKAGDQTVADQPSAEVGYAAKQRLIAIREALTKLSPQCQRAFMLHKFEGLSHLQVAQSMKISRSTVEKHMHTALKHLIRELGHD